MTSIPHLQGHHGDFAAFRDAMIETSPGRFGPLWWGIWDQHVHPDPGATLLDLGTGPGLLLESLRLRHPGARLIGVEIQPMMLEAARAIATRVGAELVEADLGTPVPLPDAVADVLTAVMVFHELVYPPAMLEEALRLLAPGGTLVLYDWVKWPLADYLEGKALDQDLLQHFREHCLFAQEDLDYLVRRAGFEIVESIGRRGGHFAVIVARKPAAQ